MLVQNATVDRIRGLKTGNILKGKALPVKGIDTHNVVRCSGSQFQDNWLQGKVVSLMHRTPFAPSPHKGRFPVLNSVRG
jgi:hypothetical protein